MAQFTIPQRKAYVRMLEDLLGKIESRYRYSDDRQVERDRIAKAHKLDELRKNVEDAEALVEKDLEAFDEKREAEKRVMLKEIALGTAEIWSCETANEAKDIVAKFVKVEFPDS
jgi:hypothetical protein